VPEAAGDVGARGGGAFLPLVFEGSADEDGREDVGIGGGVGDDEVFSAGLADEAGGSAVAADLLAEGSPAGPVGGGLFVDADSGEGGVGGGDVGDGEAVAGDEIDDAGREAGFFEDPHEEDGGVGLGGGGFPDDDVAHERGRGGEV